jgi:hypothetical protein
MRNLATLRFNNGTQQTIDIDTIPKEYTRKFHGKATDGTEVHSITLIDIPGSLDVVLTHSNPTAGCITIPRPDLDVFTKQYRSIIER